MKRSPYWRNPFAADPDAEKKARRRRSYGSVQESAYYESRRDAMVLLHRDGATLEEIGAVYGVTRERTRQVIAGATKRGTGLDPIKTIKVCRRAGSLSAAVREMGIDGERAADVRAFLVQTGYWPAMHRLWKWRQSKLKGKISNNELIAKLRALAEKLGHTPGMNEVNATPGMPNHMVYVRAFGNWAPACSAAGLSPTRRGGAHDVSRNLAA